MKTHNILLLSIGLLCFLSCKRVREKKEYTRIVFDSDSLRVVSSAVNKKLETMAVLYGNNVGYKTLIGSGSNHRAGELYKFVTWKYQDNPSFYGSKINGELLSVETISIQPGQGESIKINYRVERGKILPVNGVALNKQERISYILAYKPAILP